ncbi:hypothetical protein [Parvibacter caecicola]|uniref:hypothetical protein n=1 Tax=Parvibacter caecicola TaxID=747645 RepID=UPI002731EE69|nr:hypothetical protein [Parvibacter caecicola]
MSSLIFKRLIVFSPVEEKAKIVDLKPGLNIVTSVQKDGNDLGKSILAKSFYHCLGADCLFDNKFDAVNKIFSLTLEFEDKGYTLYRSHTLFKLFDSDGSLLWETSHRHRLAELLYEQFGYAIWLPARESKEIEIAPPAYSYAPYFIDQNHYNGSNFNSFDSLGQYLDYKGNLIYTFTGAYDEDYFEIRAQKDPLESQQKNARKALDLNIAMAEHISEELAGLGYSTDMVTLNTDCDAHEAEYKNLSQQLGKLRDKLYELREKRAHLFLALNGAEALGKHFDKRIEAFDGNTCPICNNEITSDISIRVAACVTHADILILGDELRKELEGVERQIARRESRYKDVLHNLNILKSTMRTIKEADLTAIQIEGLTRLDEKLTFERGALEREFDDLDKRLTDIDKLLKGYSEEKTKVNDRYIELISSYTHELNLQSVNLDKIKHVTDRFNADGSNAPLATVAWYFSLLRLKEELNPERVSLPLILDSPMNVEADDEKYDMHYRQIFTKFQYPHQMLVTGLGLANSSVVPSDANIIVLENEKYHLLNRDDFDEAKEFMFECMEQHLVEE